MACCLCPPTLSFFKSRSSPSSPATDMPVETSVTLVLNLGMKIMDAADKAYRNKQELRALAERSRKLLLSFEEDYAQIAKQTDTGLMSSMLWELETALRRVLSICDKQQPRSKLLSIWKRDNISFAIQLAEKDLERAFRQFNMSMMSQLRVRQEQESVKLEEVLITMRTMAFRATSNILAIPSNDPVEFDNLLLLNSNTSQESLITLQENTQKALTSTASPKEQEFLRAAIHQFSQKLPEVPSPVLSMTCPDTTRDQSMLPPWFDHVPLLGTGTEVSEIWKRISEIAAIMSGLEDMGNDMSFHDLALKAMDLSLALVDLGFRDDASELALKATEVYRSLAQVEPDTYSLYLAASLMIVSNSLYLRGRPGDMHNAQECATEAIEIYRKSETQAVRIQLARCLTTQAKTLNDLGLYNRALDSIEEAVLLLQASLTTLPAPEQESVLVFLADALDTKHRSLAFLRRASASLAVIEEVLVMRRALVVLNPDAYRPRLAISLNNYAIELNSIGRVEEALTASTESVDIRRELATIRRSQFQPYLARSMHTLSNILGNLGQSEEGLRVIEEVVRIRREEVEQFPGGRFRSSLARALRTLAWRLDELGGFDRALVAAEESVSLYKPLVEERPRFYALPMAMSLYTAGKALIVLNRPTEALEYLNGSLAIFREYQKRTEEGSTEVEEQLLWQEGLVCCLQLLGEVYTKIDSTPAAHAVREEARPLEENLLSRFPHLAARGLGKMLY